MSAVPSATHTRTVETFLKTPCDLQVTGWPYDCDAARKHPDHIVTTCRTHHTWWHTSPTEKSAA